MITPEGFLGTLRAHWLMLLVLAVLGPVLGFLGQGRQDPQHTANRLLVVSARGGESLTDLSQGASYAVGRAEALAYIGNTDTLLFDGLVQLGIDPSTWGQFRVRAGVPRNTSYIEVNTQAPTAQAALNLARVAAEKIVAASRLLTAAPTEAGKPSVLVQDITPVPVRSQAYPVGLPRWLLPLAGAVLLPLIGFFVLAVRNAVKPTVGESMDLDEVLPYPIVRNVPADEDARSFGAGGQSSHNSAISRYALMDTETRGRVVSVIPVDGPSDHRPALALARSLAHLGRRTTVLDADLRQPSMRRMTDGGLASLLQTGGDPRRFLEVDTDSAVQLLPTSPHPDAARLLLSDKAQATVRGLCGENDFVFISGAPVLQGPESVAIGRLSDEVILTADDSTRVDRIVDSGRSFPEGLVSGLLVLDGRRPRRSRQAGSGAAGTEEAL